VLYVTNIFSYKQFHSTRDLLISTSVAIRINAFCSKLSRSTLPVNETLICARRDGDIDLFNNFAHIYPVRCIDDALIKALRNYFVILYLTFAFNRRHMTNLIYVRMHTYNESSSIIVIFRSDMKYNPNFNKRTGN